MINPIEPARRLDRHTVYIGLLVALWIVALGVAIAPIGADESVMGAMSQATQIFFAQAMIVGSTLALAGAALGGGGPRWLRWFGSEMETHNCYLVGIGGLIPVCITMGGYAWNVLTHSTLVGNLISAIPYGVLVSFLVMIWQLYREYRRLSGNRTELERAATDGTLRDVIAQIDDEGGE